MKNFILSIIVLCAPPAAAQWQPKQAPLMTRWARDVSPSNVHAEYPRPQLVRDRWMNLNGLWDYAITAKDASRPTAFEGEILVPFPVESALSGVMRPVDEKSRVWYRRSFDVPEQWSGQRILLHFEAVDWEATVWINGRELGTHRGGYDPFSHDITGALAAEGPQELVVAVWDPTDTGRQPLGKQTLNPRGIWYTATTGIWQTVWLEPVPSSSIETVLVTPDVDGDSVHLEVRTDGDRRDWRFEAEVSGPGLRVLHASSQQSAFDIVLPNARLWSPDSPFLYDLEIRAIADGGEVVDRVKSYFGMRKIEARLDPEGVNRLYLNGEPLFQIGQLDQGFWPDGLYTAPTDEALRYDIETMKKLGFNMARKHVKVEPARWYYWADRLGLLIWQDMPSGDDHVAPRKGEIRRTPESARQFETELKALIDARRHHPSIVLWVVFNEGWGQYDTRRLSEWVKAYDPTRLVIGASGWNDMGSGDGYDIHSYPGPAIGPLDPQRAALLGEFGGLGLPVKGHTWQEEKNWGYRNLTSAEELEARYVRLLDGVKRLIGDGLAAAIYTQTTDVEIEVNGLMTYDRVLKTDVEPIARANRRLHLKLIQKPIVAASRDRGFAWRYTLTQPAPSWFDTDFDDSTWSEGLGGFGVPSAVNSFPRTPWTSDDIWIRRSFQLENLDFQTPYLLIHHDEDAEVYINGVHAASIPGYTKSYVLEPIEPEAAAALKAGDNVLAVHCRQTRGDQYIDVGLVDWAPADMIQD